MVFQEGNFRQFNTKILIKRWGFNLIWWDETLLRTIQLWPRSVFRKENYLTWIHPTLNLKRLLRRMKSLINNWVCILYKFKITFNNYILWIKKFCGREIFTAVYRSRRTLNEVHWFLTLITRVIIAFIFLGFAEVCFRRKYSRWVYILIMRAFTKLINEDNAAVESPFPHCFVVLKHIKR